MPLFVVATPIGNNEDFTVRGLNALKNADLIIGEELKALRQILKAAGVNGKELDQLNEHSDAKDIEHLAPLCATKNVVLVSDCGTPGFCDPGADLVAACVKLKIPVHSLPGPSSLMALLSLCGQRTERFYFYGFLPAKREARELAWKQIKKSTEPVIVMDTPYRASLLITELAENVPQCACVVGLGLTRENEVVLRGRAQDLKKQKAPDDLEPIAIFWPSKV